MYLTYKNYDFFSVKQRSINGENVHINMLDDEMQGFVLPLLNSNQVVHMGSGVDHSLGRYNSQRENCKFQHNVQIVKFSNFP